MKGISCIFLLCCLFFSSCTDNSPRRAEVLFLGHKSEHHHSDKYAPWLAVRLFQDGINMTYTTSLDDLNEENLAKYDGLIIYANHDSISSSQESALKNFVEGGKGLIPLHCATGCFKNSDWYIEAIGGQFASHETGRFKATIVDTAHAVMQGIPEFTTWDETYVHQRLNPDMTVLTERVEGDHREPYTWVREQGKGRIFYTAYGHNDSTWTNDGFLDLVTNGVLWALGGQVQEQITALNIPEVSIYDLDTMSDFTRRYLVPEMQKALTPEESMKLVQVPVDFKVELFAAEPDITNPIAMSWDERGRLWIVESVDYPNTFLETDGEANDRIKICEDTDGDGKADKFTVFADSLNIPTSIVFAGGGIIVSQAPHFVFMKDTDGDDKADVRENIITGWGKNDTHAGPSNLVYGFDNKVWGVLGFSGFNGTVDGRHMSFGQGVYRFNPDGSDFEYLASTSNNTWGLGFTEENNVFISTANNTHSAWYSMPQKYMARELPGGRQVQAVQKIDGHYDVHALTPNLRQVDVVGGFTAAAGHHFYTARNYPKEYWNRIAFVSEPTVRLVHSAIIEPDGSGFTEKDGWNLMAGSDEWFGPVQAQVGPDGAVWVADWYNFIIQHNVFVPAQAPSELVLPFTEQPHGQGNAFESPLRDINHGRIYRVVYKEADKPSYPELSVDDPAGLVNALKNDNMFWRMTAQRLLVGSADLSAVQEDLFSLVASQDVDEIGLNSPAVHALWTLHGLGAFEQPGGAALQVAVKALSHPAAGVRKAAVEVLPKNAETAKAVLESGILNDPDLNTRVSAFLAIAALPASEELGREIYQATQDTINANDKWLPSAMLAAAAAHQDGFLSASSGGSAGGQAAGSEASLSRRIASSLSNEEYRLNGRDVLRHPPHVAGKAISVSATVSRRDNKPLEGLILAQGNKTDGYGLFVSDGKLSLVVNQDGKAYTATSSRSLPDRFELVARLDEGGAMSILVNGREVASGKAPSLFTSDLQNPVRTGREPDESAGIADYEGAFDFSGGLQDLSLKFTAGAAKAGDKEAAAAGGEAVIISMGVVPDLMQYNKKAFTVKAGQRVIIEFENNDAMQHNMLIIKPGTLEKVGAAADDLARNPKDTKKQYVPEIPEVMYATDLLNPGEMATLEFTAPEKPGDYPFVCTFPGHWRGMNGIMKVE
ncbi:putative membrane-bound dehydrogenase-like protein [Anseongella ginsenosidimutans]|uniref:Putative membrane-bound dehydrogenase-like protein n=1 Tax=Anseongella ginsenosidimutans TaxID=496056 RepID=A0A4R3KWD6_9SPHI|nr:PVC-type heme-binding CxxCH protein [Anseongella ginsenosidimutans]QEC51242.1 dehydrogenase [Anseongella ginsenosidimutans]TCS90079.1 putative membrane-bound dehydrogenase-like protein [Anseongella ginsenosidimutans]